MAVLSNQQPPFPGKARVVALFTLAAIAVPTYLFLPSTTGPANHIHHVPQNARRILDTCTRAKMTPDRPSADSRQVSERFEPGTKPVFIQNATIWTGVKQENGRVKVVRGDLLLDGGVIHGIYEDGVSASEIMGHVYGKEGIEIRDVGGAWVTPAIFDMHSHVGVASLPGLRGSDDDNSFKDPIMPFLRSFDGLNTHDESYELFRAGGVAASLILPGSGDNIGGQAFAIKLGKNARKRGPSAMVVEPPEGLFVTRNETFPAEENDGVRWRHIKHACGENPSGSYSQTRMDTVWNFRKAYNAARELMVKQDEYCSDAQAGLWDELQGKEYPEDLKIEALVNVLRGKVKVHVHCYETVDLDGIVRLSNEFKFPIAAFHHAHEAYLVPDLIKQAWGKAPALALFSSFARYKREAYRGSEFAAKILNDNDLRVVMKSDGPPALNARYLMYEAALAHYYGLPADIAIASLTTTPAEVAGYGHRLGFVKPGYDADVVVWDSHPLSLGATPQQVYIDGLPQLDDPAVLEKSHFLQTAPRPPSWDQEAKDTLASDGLPDLLVSKDKAEAAHTIVFENVGLLMRDDDVQEFGRSGGVVVFSHGNVTCVGHGSDCASYATSGAKHVDLEHGSIVPGLVSFGAALGLVEIDAEGSTNDGSAPDGLEGGVPKIAGGDDFVARAVDGLSFVGRDSLLAYRGGVTANIEAPSSSGLIQGVSVAFRTGAAHKLEAGAIAQREVALHARIIHDETGANAMVSTKVATLRKLLLGGLDGDKDSIYARVVKGQLPFVVSVEKADIMATLLQLKIEVEAASNAVLHMVFAGATESHLIASELAKAQVGVILAPLRSFPRLWDQRRYIPGPPLTAETPLRVLLKAGVTVAVGMTSIAITQAWDVHHIRFNLGWAMLDSNGTLSQKDAWALSTINIKKLFKCTELDTDLVAYKGGSAFEYSSKPLAVLSATHGHNDLF
ncbi:hypothetical protein BDV93DRAFT_547903 [Ceratobasidium sp. AG-I]|nr:hypothetical protein BDV93DRAFT_547903 [Ceratobasidium sp. AG-I]